LRLIWIDEFVWLWGFPWPSGWPRLGSAESSGSRGAPCWSTSP